MKHREVRLSLFIFRGTPLLSVSGPLQDALKSHLFSSGALQRPSFISCLEGNLGGRKCWEPNSAEPPPITGENLFYVQTIEGLLKAIRADNGKLAWTYNDPWGVTTVFSETNNVLYLKTSDGSIVAVRTSDGKRLWHIQPIASPFTVEALSIEGNTAYASTQTSITDVVIIALRLSDGTQLWQRKMMNMSNSVVLPQMSEGQLLISSGSTITALRARDGAIL